MRYSIPFVSFDIDDFVRKTDILLIWLHVYDT